MLLSSQILHSYYIFCSRVVVNHGVSQYPRARIVPWDSIVVQHRGRDRRSGKLGTWWERAFSTTNEGRYVRVASDFEKLQWPQVTRQLSACTASSLRRRAWGTKRLASAGSCRRRRLSQWNAWLEFNGSRGGRLADPE
jgi:hypothetical protein